jgi:hypothetical protein
MRMKKRTIAAMLYAVLGFLAFAVLAIFVAPEAPLPVVASNAGAMLLIGVLASLGAGSVAMIGLLLRGAALPVLVIRLVAVSLPIVAVGWNVVASVFWLLPLYFVWRSEKG